VRTDKVYLVGFMGAGKTTLARALGARLDWRVEDVDERIETREGRAISTIFSREGEGYFRDVERQVLLDLLPLRHAVVATGGGTFADPENRALINRDGLSVWIDVPLTALVDRVPSDGRRPLAADRSRFEQLFQTRRIAYRQAHVRLDAADAAVDALVEQLLDHLDH
jgi:shikimate kinase